MLGKIYVLELLSHLSKVRHVLVPGEWENLYQEEDQRKRKNNRYKLPLLLTGVKISQVTYSRNLNNATDYPCES
jgi:hypothetical protein